MVEQKERKLYVCEAQRKYTLLAYLLHMTQQAYRIIYVLINLQSILIIFVFFPSLDTHTHTRRERKLW